MLGLAQRNRPEPCPFVFISQDGVLMRKWRAPDVPASDQWLVREQIVVPQGYRININEIGQ